MICPASGAAHAPPPSPYDPDLDLVGWVEDPDHGPSRPRTWRCLFRCPHRRQGAPPVQRSQRL